LDPPLADPGPPLGGTCPAVAEGDVAAERDVAVAEEDVAATESPITAHISAAAPIHPLLVFDSDRRTAPPELPATDGPDVALVSWGLVGLSSFMMGDSTETAIGLGLLREINSQPHPHS
jgi:hypothetical protein